MSQDEAEAEEGETVYNYFLFIMFLKWNVNVRKYQFEPHSIFNPNSRMFTELKSSFL